MAFPFFLYLGIKKVDNLWLIIGHGSWVGVLVHMIVIGDIQIIYREIVWIGVILQYVTLGLVIGTISSVRLLSVLGFFMLVNSIVILPLVVFDVGGSDILYVMVGALVVLLVMFVMVNGMIFRRMLLVSDINTMYRCVSCGWIGGDTGKCHCGFDLICVGCIHKNCKDDICDLDK